MATAERRLTRKGQAVRDRIVDAATELIAQHGVAGTNTDQVRQLAGVSGSQLYHYFDSKQALIRAVITRQADAVGVTEGPALGALDSFEALRAWADAAIARQREQDGRGSCDLTTLAGELAVHDEDSRAEICQGFLRWKQVLSEGLHAMQRRGDLEPSANPDELAYALLAAHQGGVLLSQTLRDTTPLEASLNAALTYIHTFAR
ncbi:TetR family transcriptional regulator [Kribbella sp. NPDC048915]|uniref:TetR/AcrR family transcriptional regulator n=1 Tax=Kribbella sp. NPDC048915 TaxID=3155148 RepID=UPI0033DAE162